MSSILDALNKLEQEKAAKQSQPGDYEPTLSPEEAASVLLGESSVPEREKRMPVWLPVVLALCGGFVLALVPVGYFLAVKGGATPPEQVAGAPAADTHSYQMPVTAPPPVAAPVPEEKKAASKAEPAGETPPTPPPAPPKSAPAAVPEKKETTRPPLPESIPLPDRFPQETSAPPPVVKVADLPPPVPEPAPVPEPVAPVPPPAPAPVSEPAPVPVPEPVAPVPPPASVPAPEPVAPAPPPAPVPVQEPVVVPVPAPVPAPAERSVIAQTPSEYPSASAGTVPRVPSARSSGGAVSVDNLPRLSSQERARFGLDGLRVNVLRPADKDQPDALAIINLKKVYVGETIPGTRARLIGVASSGIGIEIEVEGSNKQFRIPR
ncbi:MAG TPA: hypothetical protein PKN92_01620 [Candidatus Hydrogenedentes bacterium]|nr:hypothetical protein [Candidatus Hydrogenedentota bacterium]HPX86147.1 hypothetical protein [Candidatus Hydrogenedentota bacterium]